MMLVKFTLKTKCKFIKSNLEKEQLKSILFNNKVSINLTYTVLGIHMHISALSQILFL